MNRSLGNASLCVVAVIACSSSAVAQWNGGYSTSPRPVTPTSGLISSMSPFQAASVPPTATFGNVGGTMNHAAWPAPSAGHYPTTSSPPIPQMMNEGVPGTSGCNACVNGGGSIGIPSPTPRYAQGFGQGTVPAGYGYATDAFSASGYAASGTYPAHDGGLSAQSSIGGSEMPAPPGSELGSVNPGYGSGMTMNEFRNPASPGQLPTTGAPTNGSDSSTSEFPMIGTTMDVWSGSCGPTPTFGTPPRPRVGPTWFGGVYGLIMNRDDENGRNLLVDPTVENGTYLNTRDADMEYSGGYELRLGRVFDCGNWGLEFVYWELFPGMQEATVCCQAVGATLWGTIPYTDVYLTTAGPQDTAYNLFAAGNIFAARIQRDFDFQNIELNLISRPLYAGGGLLARRRRPLGPGRGGLAGPAAYYGPSVGRGCGTGSCGLPTCGNGCGCHAATSRCCGACPPRLHIGWLFGVRYFSFDESLLITYDNADNVFDGSNPGSELHHDVQVDNDLIGAQLGLNLDYYLTPSLQFEAGTRFGLYGNRISQYQCVCNEFGPAYILPGSTQFLDIQSTSHDVAFLGDLRLGLAYKVGCHWRLTGGYRALAASGVALAPNQLPFGRTYTDLRGISHIDRNGSLILHGAYGGAEFAW